MARGTPQSVIDMLSAVPLFSTCTQAELTTIANLGAQVTVNDGVALTTQGQPGREFLLLVDGDVRCVVDGAEVATLTSGDFFGEMALLAGNPRNATVVAKGLATVLAFDASEFRTLLDLSPSINEKVLAAASDREPGS